MAATGVGDMVGIQVRASEGLALTGVGGIALLGNLLERHTDFRSSFTAAFTKRRDGIPWGDVLLTYVASLATGKSDFEAIRPWHGKTWVGKALRISKVASPETVRQHLDNLADGHSYEALALAGQANLDLLARGKAPFTRCSSGHVPLDVDTTPQENGKTRKEGVSRTYMPGVDGFCPIFAFAGMEGWCINEAFRPGKQHSQKGASDFLRTSIRRLKSLGIEGILTRMDAAFDASENYVLLREEGSDFLIKGNLAHLRWDGWQAEAQALPKQAWKRIGRNRRVAYLSRFETRSFDGQEVEVRRILKVTKRLGWELKDVPPGQPLLVKRWIVFEVETWIASLDLPEADIVALYCQHATAEQFHSEIKSELDLERMPSGYFKTNALVLRLGTLAYNALRLLGILGKRVFRHRHPTQRRRLRTIIQELIYVPARILTGSNQLKLDLGRNLYGRAAYLELWASLARAA
jgi:Transposase DDE domain group 1